MTTKRFATILLIALICLINTACSIFRSSSERKRDADMDGVRNKIDKCPDTPFGTSVDSNGCPLDSDADGVADFHEEWPETAPIGNVRETSSAATIWIDSDGDGIHDSLDQCPTMAGPASNSGCPENLIIELNAGASPVEYINIAAVNEIQDTILKSATLGYTFDKKIRSLEDGFLRVVVKINSSANEVKTMIRKFEKDEFQVELDKDTNTIFIISDIEAYQKMEIRTEYDSSDFILTPIETVELQNLDFVNGNNWLWKIKAVSETPHTANITLIINGITPDSARHKIAIRQAKIEIDILPPPSPPPKPWFQKILGWAGDNIIWIITFIITPVFIHYRSKILLYLKTRKEKEK